MLLTLAALLGCTDPVEELTPQAIIGTGEWAWEDLEDGASMPVIQGPQGGYHLLGSVRIVGLEAGDPDDLRDPDNPTTTFEVLLNDQNLTPTSSYVQGLDPVLDEETPWSHEMIGRFAILDITDDDELDGLSLTLGVRVVDVTGKEARDNLTIIAYPDPRNR